MYKIQNSQSGFSVVEGLLILVIVGIFGFTGWYVWNVKQNADKGLSSNKSTPPVVKKTNTETMSSTQSVNPYSAWKQYCDTLNKLCYKYPSEWIENDSTQAFDNTGTYVQSTLQNNNEAVDVSYRTPYIKDGNNFDFLTMKIEDVPSFPLLKVVGGIYINPPDGGYYIQFAVVNTSLVQEDDLSIGKTSQFINTARFNLQGKDDIQFVAVNTKSVNGGSYSTLDDARSWFTSQAAKNSLLILQSLSPQK